MPHSWAIFSSQKTADDQYFTSCATKPKTGKINLDPKLMMIEEQAADVQNGNKASYELKSGN